MRRFPAGARSVVALLVVVGSACHRTEGANSDVSGSTPRTGVCAGTDVSPGDALAAVCTEGVLHVAMDPSRKPTSWFDASTQQWNGFDVEVANEIAKRLGVGVSLDPAPPAAIARGSWRGRWDVSVSSLPDTAATEQRFLFSPAYYFDPGAIVVPDGDTAITEPAELDGARVCAAAGSSEEAYARGHLSLGPSAPPIAVEPRGAVVRPMSSASAALEELGAGGGRCDAVVAPWWEASMFIDAGGGVTIVGEPPYYVPLAVAFDDHDVRDMHRLLDAVSTIVADMHDDGTLAALSEKWFEGANRTDATPPPTATPSP